MATSRILPFSTSTSSHFHPQLHHFSPTTNHHFLSFPKRTPFSSPLSASNSSSPSQPLQNGRSFLTDQDLKNFDLLADFSYHQELESGFLWVRVMREEEIDMTVGLLSESFAESVLIAGTGSYVKLLEFLVKNYLIERRERSPHNATLIGVYRESDQPDYELAGTVELTFDRRGANANPPTPPPPKNAPYICNMAVRSALRRRGIGWHLLKAGEELIAKITSSSEVYLHCRTIDEGPLNMYTKAGYSIVKTDSILTLLTLQRRKHLMRKELPPLENPKELPPSDNPSEIEKMSDEELSS